MIVAIISLNWMRIITITLDSGPHPRNFNIIYSYEGILRDENQEKELNFNFYTHSVSIK